MQNKFFKSTALVMLAALGLSVQAQPPAGGAARPPLVPLLIESKAFEDGGIVPLKFTMYGSNTMPDFRISNIPPTAQSIAVILHDLDVAGNNNPDDNLHWLAWNIPATPPVLQIEEGKLPEGAVNGRGRPYVGMGAPNGPRYHHYLFEFYALNSKLDLPAIPGDRPDLLAAMKGKVVAKAAYVGRFRNDTNAVRPPPAAAPAAPARQ